jgi:hypothetical protein
MSRATGAERAKKFKDDQRKLGRTRSDLWATAAERKAVKALLAKLRDKAS